MHASCTKSSGDLQPVPYYSPNTPQEYLDCVWKKIIFKTIRKTNGEELKGKKEEKK